jgi:hypothetical protein
VALLNVINPAALGQVLVVRVVFLSDVRCPASNRCLGMALTGRAVSDMVERWRVQSDRSASLQVSAPRADDQLGLDRAAHGMTQPR